MKCKYTGFDLYIKYSHTKGTKRDSDYICLNSGIVGTSSTYYGAICDYYKHFEAEYPNSKEKLNEI